MFGYHVSEAYNRAYDASSKQHLLVDYHGSIERWDRRMVFERHAQQSERMLHAAWIVPAVVAGAAF